MCTRIFACEMCCAYMRVLICLCRCVLPIPSFKFFGLIIFAYSFGIFLNVLFNLITQAIYHSVFHLVLGAILWMRNFTFQKKKNSQTTKKKGCTNKKPHWNMIFVLIIQQTTRQFSWISTVFQNKCQCKPISNGYTYAKQMKSQPKLRWTMLTATVTKGQ